MWLGYFEEFPDYMTQGESLAELEENLRDLIRT
jgi:predicted RNase H-like HicB family nuclease